MKKTKKNKRITSRQATNKMIKILGGIVETSRQFNVHHETIRQWQRAGKVPAKRVLQAYELVEGQIKFSEFRPDVYPEAFGGINR